MTRSGCGVVAAVLAVLALGPGDVNAAINDTELISGANLALDRPASGPASSSVPSADGRFVAFASSGDNLPGANGHTQVYVRDALTNTTTLVSSVSGTDTPGNDDSEEPSISADGRFVAFASSSGNLPGGGTGRPQVYVHDTRTGATVLVSAADGTYTPGAGESWGPSISADGRHVAFVSIAANLPGSNGYAQVYVRDTRTKATTLVSGKGGATTAGNDDSDDPSISADGRSVAFRSSASDLPGADGDNRQVFVRDTRTRATTLVSAEDGTTAAGNDDSDGPSISADGRSVAFSSRASNLPGGDGATGQVYVRDTQAKVTMLVSARNGSATAGNAESGEPSISADGRRVAFASAAGNLPSGGKGLFQVYVRDLGTQATVLASAAGGSRTAGNGHSAQSRITADGRYVTFTSLATNLPHANGVAQVYRRDVLGAAPRNIARPLIAGSAAVGGTLTCSIGEWSPIDPPVAFAVRWQRDDIDIPGADQTAYAVQATDAGRSLRCVVTATNPGGSAAVTTDPVVPQLPVPPAPDGVPGPPAPGGVPEPPGPDASAGAGGDLGPPNPQGQTGSPSPQGQGGSAGVVVVARPGRIVARAGRAIRIRYRVSANATVRLDVRRAGKKKVIATRTVRVRAGRGSMVWNGRVGRSPARPGRYTLTLTATAPRGAATATVSVRLTQAPRGSRRGRR